jgi:hypothetical protein
MKTEITFEREKLLQFFYAIKEQADEGMIEFTKDKLAFHSTDIAGACFIDAAFITPIKDEFRLAIDVQKYYSTLNAMKTKAVVIEFDRHAIITGGKLKREVTSLVEEVLRKQSMPPALTFPACIEAPASDLIDFLESVDKMGTEEGALPVKVFVELKDKKFKLYSVNELKEKTVSEFDMISIEKDSKVELLSGFSFDYLLKIAKNIKKTKIDKIKIYMGNNFPCRIEIENDYLSVAWIVAPRIEDD